MAFFVGDGDYVSFGVIWGVHLVFSFLYLRRRCAGIGGYETRFVNEYF